jgi:hypothetical protein
MALEKRNKRIEAVLIKSEAMNTGNAILSLHTTKYALNEYTSETTDNFWLRRHLFQL